MSRSQQHMKDVHGYSSNYEKAEWLETEEGGGEESWWDETALVDIDFVNDRAWTAADGEVAIDTLMGTDAATASGWGDATAYNPSQLGESGYEFVDGGRAVAFIDEAKSSILAGATIRVDWLTGEVTNTEYPMILSDALGSYAVYMYKNNAGNLSIESWGGVSSDGVALGASPERAAFIFTSTRGEFSLDGSSPATTESFTTDDYPAEGFDCAFIYMTPSETGGPFLQRVTIYAPLPDATGLPALSELA